jgi:protein phosphatase
MNAFMSCLCPRIFRKNYGDFPSIDLGVFAVRRFVSCVAADRGIGAALWNSARVATSTPGARDAPECNVHFATRSDRGTQRPDNEDACGTYVESATRVLVAVADGVSGENGGQMASRTAIDVTLRAYRESPGAWAVPRRIYRAVQEANIEVHDIALVVPELRRMSTTLTAVVVDGGMAYATHVGDSRLYLVREKRIVQKTKDHTLADRCTLTRSLGRDLIAAVDRISFPVAGGDVLCICSDGLYNVLGEDELRDMVVDKDVDVACADLIDAANARGTPDNLTVAVVRINGQPPVPQASGLRGLLSRILGR